jgi:hypothetical protein
MTLVEKDRAKREISLGHGYEEREKKSKERETEGKVLFVR